MLNSKELDQELDKLLRGEAVEENDQLINIAKDVAGLSKIKPDEKRKALLKNEFISSASNFAGSQKSREVIQIRTERKKIHFMNLRRAAAVAVVLLMSSGTTVYAATSSMPDSHLYTVKRATETASLYLIPSSLKTGLETKFSKKRIREIEYMLKKKNSNANEKIINKLITDVKGYGKTVSEEKGLRNQIKKLDMEVDAKFNKNSKSTEKKNNDFKPEKINDEQSNGVGKAKSKSSGNFKKPQ